MVDHLKKERDKYTKMWDMPKYRERSPGMRMVDDAFKMLKMKSGDSLCDYGAGTGRASQCFADKGLAVTAFDIAENAITEFDGEKVIGTLWDMPDFGSFDYGFCCDVMEHLPTEHIDASLKGIADRSEQAAYFQIALFECHMGDEIGEHLHLTVKPQDWWMKAMKAHFKNVEVVPHKKYFICKCTK